MFLQAPLKGGHMVGKKESPILLQSLPNPMAEVVNQEGTLPIDLCSRMAAANRMAP